MRDMRYQCKRKLQVHVSMFRVTIKETRRKRKEREERELPDVNLITEGQHTNVSTIEDKDTKEAVEFNTRTRMRNALTHEQRKPSRAKRSLPIISIALRHSQPTIARWPHPKRMPIHPPSP